MWAKASIADPTVLCVTRMQMGAPRLLSEPFDSLQPSLQFSSAPVLPSAPWAGSSCCWLPLCPQHWRQQCPGPQGGCWDWPVSLLACVLPACLSCSLWDPCSALWRTLTQSHVASRALGRAVLASLRCAERASEGGLKKSSPLLDFVFWQIIKFWNIMLATLCVPKKMHMWASTCGGQQGKGGSQRGRGCGGSTGPRTRRKGLRRKAGSEEMSRQGVNMIDLGIWSKSG